MNKRILFALWGGMFLLCAGLGFLPEENFFLTLAALASFAPPTVLLYRAGTNRDVHTLTLVRNLSALSLGLTLAFLVLNLMSTFASETLGTFVYYILVIVSSPMICSGHWALSMFCWACLLTAASQLLKKA